MAKPASGSATNATTRNQPLSSVSVKGKGAVNATIPRL